jgi:hypothetical protein
MVHAMANNGREAALRSLLDRLCELERRWAYPAGEAAKQGKDAAANEALGVAEMLVSAVAGWAINHQIGLALNGLQFVPMPTLGTFGTSKLSEFRKARDAVDDHRHECVGATFRYKEEDDGVAARKALINLLRPGTAGLNTSLQQLLLEALEGLDYGEVHPVLRPRGRRKKGPAELKSMLRALAFVEYRRERGSTKEDAIHEIACAFNVDIETIGSWENRLSQEFDRLAVAQEISFARNAASFANGGNDRQRKRADDEYGSDALIRLAKQYRAAQKRRSKRVR